MVWWGEEDKLCFNRDEVFKIMAHSPWHLLIFHTSYFYKNIFVWIVLIVGGAIADEKVEDNMLPSQGNQTSQLSLN